MFDHLDFEVSGLAEEENADELYRLTVAEHNRPWPKESRHCIPAALLDASRRLSGSDSLRYRRVAADRIRCRFSDAGQAPAHQHRGGWRYRKISRLEFERTSPLGKVHRTGRPP